MNKKNIVMYIVIVLLLAGVIALGMYAKEANKKEDSQLNQITNNQNINNKNTQSQTKKQEQSKTNNEDNKKVDTIENNSELEELATNLMKTYNTTFCGNEMHEIYLNDYTDYSKLSTSYKYGLVLNSKEVRNTSEDDGNGYQYKYIMSVVDDKFHSLFGYGKEIELKKIVKSTNIDNTIKANGKSLYVDGNYYYSVNAYGCGTGSLSHDIYEIIDTKKSENKLEITIKYLYINGLVGDDSYDIYAKYGYDYNDKVKVGIVNCGWDVYDLCTEPNKITRSDANKLMSTFKDKLNSYKWTFKYDNEHKNYYFYSVEKVK